MLEAEDDDGGSGFTSLLALDSVAGRSYLLAVDGFSGAEGSFELSFPVTGTTLSAVPLPGGLALLLSGVGFLVGVRRLG